MTPWWAEKCHDKAMYGAAQTERSRREIEQMRARLEREAEARWQLAKAVDEAQKGKR